ncbi:MAG: hypothetical protein KJ006_07075 [Thermoleophilia bacterium]|nr:hypothetical protein [Thermoleophilia bacterium]
MKYERTDSFKRDYRRLSDNHREEFRRVVREHFNPALDDYVRDPGHPWPPRLRIKGVAGMPAVWEMTWSFSDPDGRATWEWISIDGEPAIRWRRIGDHSVFDRP